MKEPTQSLPAPAPRRWRRRLPAVAAMMVTLAVFLQVLQNGFIEEWDDVGVLLSNPHYRGLGGAQILWMFTSVEFPAMLIPVSWLTWGLTYELFGMNPLGYHLGTLLFHTANAGMLAVVIGMLLRVALRRRGRGTDDFLIGVCSAAGALLWAIHPLRVEAVALASARPYSVTGFFLLLSIIAYLRYAAAAEGTGGGQTVPEFFKGGISTRRHGEHGVEEEDGEEGEGWEEEGEGGGEDVEGEKTSPCPPCLRVESTSRAISEGPWRSRSLLVFSLAAYALAMLAYPLGAGFFLVLLAVDAWPLGRFGRGATRRNLEVLLEKIPYLAISLLIIAATVHIRRGSTLMDRPPTLAEFGLGARLMQACHVWAWFVWRPLLPSFDYSPVYTDLVRFNPLGPAFIAAGGLVVLLTAASFALRGRFPGLAVAWFCHLVLLVPVLGLTVHPHYASDRYSYLQGMILGVAGAGLLLAVAEIPRKGRHPGRRGTVALAGAGLACAVLGVMSHIQINNFRDGRAFFTHILRVLGDDPYRVHILPRLALLELRAGRLDEAEALLREALAITPNAPRALHARGLVRFNRGDFAGALADFTRVTTLNPADPKARLDRGAALVRLGRPEAAIHEYRKSAELDPRSAPAWFNLGVELAKTGRGEEAAAAYEAAARADAGHAGARVNLAALKVGSGELERAEQLYRAALELDPGLAEAHNGLGAVLAMRGDLPGAAARFAEAARINPEDVGARRNLEQIRKQMGGRSGQP